MKYKYLLFGFYHYYPSGGMEDLILKFNNIEELKEQFKYDGEDVYQLVNTDNFSYIEIDVDKLFDDKYDKYDVPDEKIRELIIKQIENYMK
ncbi:hypothetical protein AXJ14_gp161 [Geobacillus virus E3]|uniref:hypothetical protein n=1 Tax=Geobacillus virus E3 TaxID=1572712 RepID=UPI0006718770|nr:hypothetical protein AXJ14_gp161 [Geobacillus virus E3]AJA41480.1 hypothetical protein E3_0161 [Geobacillus virus E3]